MRSELASLSRRFVASGALATAALITPALPSPPIGHGWTDGSLDVVGSPVAAGDVVIVFDVAKHKLELTAVRASNGAEVWHHPFSASLITPGVAFSPTVIGTTVLALSPSTAVGQVTVEGLDTESGSVQWSLTRPILAADAPAVCAGGQDFCVAAYTQVDKTALILVNATNGAVTTLTGPQRNMGVARPSAQNVGALWQTDATTPTFMQVSSTGTAVWTRSVAAVFGTSEYSPNDGWDFLSENGKDIGSVSVAPASGIIHAGDDKTVAIDETTGSVAWSASGLFLCEGPLQMLTADVVCRYSGSFAASLYAPPNSLTLAGIDPSSGATKWSVPVIDAAPLEDGNDVPFSDSTHLVVHPRSGGPMVLDVQTGTLAKPGVHQIFWCEETPTYTVTTPKELSQYGTHESEPVFRSCTASGTAIARQPSSSPLTVGVNLGGMFIWPTPAGLQARTASTSR